MGKALTPAAAPNGMTRFFFWVARVVVACAELWIAYAWFSGLTSLATLVSMHLASVGAFFGAIWLTNQKDTGGLLVEGAMLFLTGPLAAIGMSLHRQKRTVVLAVARCPIASVSPAESLYLDIIGGRRPRRDPSNQLSILDRLSSCDLATQQFAVAAVSRIYCPEMHPALMAALQSQTPAVRVQAAAVFAKLREQHASEARRILEASSSDIETLARRSQTVAACREIARSPFLDDAVTRALMDRARHLEAELPPAVSAPEPASVETESVMYDNPANEIAKVPLARVGVVKAQSLGPSWIARLSKSSSSGVERVA